MDNTEKMYGWEFKKDLTVSIIDYKDKKPRISIPEYIEKDNIKYKVVSIGDEAFKNCKFLKSITVPSGITSIGKNAFEGCFSLEEVHITDIVGWCNIDFDNKYSNPLYFAHKLYLNDELVSGLVIPPGVDSIQATFENCTSLISVKIPAGLTSISKDCFKGCTKLKEVIITDIAAWCNIKFKNEYSNPLCYAHKLYLNDKPVTDLIIPDSVTNIRSHAFYNCYSLTSIEISATVTKIGSEAFKNCVSLESIAIPSEVSLAHTAFKGCNSLIKATVPAKLIKDIKDIPQAKLKEVIINGGTEIEKNVFAGCSSLTSITIPSSVTDIGEHAFKDCSSLKIVNITDIAAWCNIKFKNEYSNPLCCAHNLYLNDKRVTDLIIPEGVTSISDYAFYHCSSLTSITIPSSVTSIGRYAFYNCSSLTSITIPAGVTNIGKKAFYYCYSLKSITIPRSVTNIGQHAFHNCSSLTKVNITDIAAWCNIKFNCNIKNNECSNPLCYAHNLYLNDERVTDLIIPEGVKSISDYAFAGCSSLTSVSIPFGVTHIGKGAFNECYRLVEVCNYFKVVIKKVADISNVDVKDNIFPYALHYYNPKTGSSKLTTEDDEYVVYTDDKDKILVDYRGKSNKLIIPNYITKINIGAFYKYSSLTSIKIPSGVISIGEYAFLECSSLKYNIYDNAKYLGNDDNPYLALIEAVSKDITECNINDKCKIIAGRAFADCLHLKSITIPSNVKTIDAYAFNNCLSLASVSMGNNIRSIGYAAFSGCKSIKNINIPPGVKEIDPEAFKNCLSLESIVIRHSLKMGWKALEGCPSSLKIIRVDYSKL